MGRWGDLGTINFNGAFRVSLKQSKRNPYCDKVVREYSSLGCSENILVYADMDEKSRILYPLSLSFLNSNYPP